MPPPPEHRGHEVLRIGQRNGLEHAQHLDPGGVEPRLLTRLAEGCRDESVVLRIDPPAWERDLPRVRAERRRAREQQHVEIA